MNPLSHPGSENGRAVLNEDQALLVFRLASERTFSQRKIGRLFGISQRTVLDILQKRTWSHLWYAEKE
jgi:DNA invertase Pin-like site-specific DNA recombinase